jgi:hypothetical protein
MKKELKMNKVFVGYTSKIYNNITNSNDVFEVENSVNTEKGLRELSSKIRDALGHGNFAILFLKDLEQDNKSEYLVTENARLKKALDFAIEKMDEYASDDYYKVKRDYWKDVISNILEGK